MKLILQANCLTFIQCIPKKVLTHFFVLLLALFDAQDMWIFLSYKIQQKQYPSKKVKKKLQKLKISSNKSFKMWLILYKWVEILT